MVKASKVAEEHWWRRRHYRHHTAELRRAGLLYTFRRKFH